MYAIALWKMLIDLADQFQILFCIETPAMLAVLPLRSERDDVEEFKIFVHVRRDVNSLIRFFSFTPCTSQRVDRKYLHVKATRIGHVQGIRGVIRFLIEKGLHR